MAAQQPPPTFTASDGVIYVREPATLDLVSITPDEDWTLLNPGDDEYRDRCWACGDHVTLSYSEEDDDDVPYDCPRLVIQCNSPACGLDCYWNTRLDLEGEDEMILLDYDYSYEYVYQEWVGWFLSQVGDRVRRGWIPRWLHEVNEHAVETS